MVSEDLRTKVSTRVFTSSVDLRTIDIEGLAAELATSYGPSADIAGIDEDTWSELVDRHDTEMQARRRARAEFLGHRPE